MIIHICNNYISSKVHKELISSINKNNDLIEQDIFIPIRRRNDNNKNIINNKRINFHYRYYPGKILRFFPFLKILWVSFLFSKLSITKKNKEKAIILAHTIWSDGAIAYINHIFNGTPYALIIRNTDLNWFIPKLPHYRWLINKIISKAKCLIFISPVYNEKLKTKYPKLYNAASNIDIIPNGVDDFWIDNKINFLKKRDPIVFFVGTFNTNKNLPEIFNSTKKAKESIPELKLYLAGGSKNQFLQLTGLKEIPNWVTILGKIENKLELLKYYRSARVFLMPSIHETFGLVYIEALSQGCPFIYTKGEGIDGYFHKESFNKAINPYNSEEIAEAILHLITDYPEGIPPKVINRTIKNFNWEEISKKYIEILNCLEK